MYVKSWRDFCRDMKKIFNQKDNNDKDTRREN